MHRLFERVLASALVALIAAACGGETKRDEIASSSGNDDGLVPASDPAVPAPVVLVPGARAMDAGVATTGDSGMPSSSASPEASDAGSRAEFPFDEAQPVSGGSVEGNPGSGWDRCISKFPGLDSASPVSASPGTGGAAHGENYLHFDSEAQCAFCSADGADSQVLFALTEAIEPTPRGLWFDVRTDDPARAIEGTLAFVSTSELCETEGSLAAVDLQELSPTEQWGTRCVGAAPEVPVHNIGVFVTGVTFAFSFDALRLGPPCEHD